MVAIETMLSSLVPYTIFLHLILITIFFSLRMKLGRCYWHSYLNGCSYNLKRLKLTLIFIIHKKIQWTRRSFLKRKFVNNKEKISICVVCDMTFIWNVKTRMNIKKKYIWLFTRIKILYTLKMNYESQSSSAAFHKIKKLKKEY